MSCSIMAVYVSRPPEHLNGLWHSMALHRESVADGGLFACYCQIQPFGPESVRVLRILSRLTAVSELCLFPA